MRVRVFGRGRIEGLATLARRDRVVMTALVAGGRDVAADRLADALYGHQPPPTWRKVVQGSIVRLRQALGARAIETTVDGYRLVIGDDDIDVRRFERLGRDASELAEVGLAARAVAVLREALDLVTGEPFADLDGWPPGRTEALRLGELRRRFEERLVDALLSEGRTGEAATIAAVLAEREPFREQRWVLLAEAYYRSGQQADALRAIDRARRLLRDELGIDPGPELVRIQRAVLEQDPALSAGNERPPAVWADCPYQGLVPFDVDDADSFFGRDDSIDVCVTMLFQTGSLAIVGPSGCGKSSLARAGIVPAIRRRGHSVAVITPGHDPLARLARVDPDSAVVLDQLEELFTMTADHAVRSEFSRLLVQRSARAPIVVTLRADFLAAVTDVGALAELVQASMYLLQPMDEARLRMAIAEPAMRAGLRLEPGLVDLVVRDVEGQSGALPLLSHALAETWKRRRDDRVLTVAGYQAGGGVRGAVAATADRVVDRLPPESRRIVRSLFLRLVSLSDVGVPISHRLSRGDVAPDSRHVEVIDALLFARLLTANADSIEVTHEALGRAWPRLQNWLEEDREGQRLLRHLSASATEWERSGRDDSELYRGARLRSAQEWAATADHDLTISERDFLDQSAARQAAEEEDLAARAGACEPATATIIGRYGCDAGRGAGRDLAGRRLRTPGRTRAAARHGRRSRIGTDSLGQPVMVPRW